jgi:WD40 repeat protein
MSPDGKQVVTAGSDRMAIVWDASTGGVQHVLAGHRDTVIDARFSPDGDHVVTASADRTAKLWRAGALVHTFPTSGEARVAAFTPDGSRVGIGSSDGVVTIWDVKSGHRTAQLREHRGAISSLSFDHAGRMLTSSEDGTARLWTAEGPLLHTASPSSPSNSGVVAAQFSPDGRTIATGSADGLVGLWEVATARIRRLEGHTGVVLAVSFSGDGSRLVTASIDGTARIWDMTGQLISTLQGRSGGAIWSAQFDDTGRLVATTGVDGVVDIWDSQRGQLVASWRAHRGMISQALLDRGRRRLVTAGFDGSSAVWPITLESGSLDVLDELARCTVPLTLLDSGRLIPRVLERCPAHERGGDADQQLMKK